MTDLELEHRAMKRLSFIHICKHMSFPCSSVGKESTYNAGDLGLIPGFGRSPGEGNGNPLQYSCLENPMDCSLPASSVHGVARVGHDLATKPPKTTVQFSRSVVSDSLQSHGLQHARPPCPLPAPEACSNTCPSSQ